MFFKYEVYFSKMAEEKEDRASKKSKVDVQEKTTLAPIPEDSTVKFSKIARNFQTNMLPKGEIEVGMIPGIGKVALETLKINSIKTCDHLVGLFFMCDRDEAEFIERLEELGIRNQDARETAFQFHRKFHGY